MVYVKRLGMLLRVCPPYSLHMWWYQALYKKLNCRGTRRLNCDINVATDAPFMIVLLYVAVYIQCALFSRVLRVHETQNGPFVVDYLNFMVLWHG